MSTPAAGWFPDPAGRPDGYRWWDGAAWTRYLTDDPTGPAPVDAGQPAAAQPERPMPAPQHAAAPLTPAIPKGRRQMPPGYDFSRPDRAPRRANRRLVPALAVLAVVVVAAVLVSVAVHARTEASSLLAPPPPVSSVEAAKVRVTFDDSTRSVTAKPLQVTMPGAPYTTLESSAAGFGVFKDGSVQSSVDVQKDYNGKGDAWVAVVAAGIYEPEDTGKTVQDTAERVFQTMADKGYDGIKISIKNATSKKLTGYSAKGWIVTGDIHYKEKGIKSTYDIVSVLVIDAGGGQHVGWLTSRPNKSAPAVKAAVSASIKSIKIN